MQINFAYTNLQQAKRTQHFYNTIEVLKCRELQGINELGATAPGSFHDMKGTITEVNNGQGSRRRH
jgi:hypothetical protein